MGVRDRPFADCSAAPTSAGGQYSNRTSLPWTATYGHGGASVQVPLFT